jgi:hypothetical protein
VHIARGFEFLGLNRGGRGLSDGQQHPF